MALQHRLGAHITGDAVACQMCGESMSPSCGHALCCAKAESTRGHYGVVGAMVDGFKAADSSVSTEVRGLIRDSSLRPADIFTRVALPGRDAALMSRLQPRTQQEL
eukprot:2810945-Karenia_brevis.AAC.1